MSLIRANYERQRYSNVVLFVVNDSNDKNGFATSQTVYLVTIFSRTLHVTRSLVPYLLSLFKQPEEWSHRTDIEGMCSDSHGVV